MLVYRTCKARHSIMDGTGAKLQGGRWNSAGREVVYGSASFAGSLLEILAHAAPRRLPGAHHCGRIHVRDDVEIERLEAADLPGWHAADQEASRGFGDRWLEEARTVALVVPAAAARPFGRNVVINPDHPKADRVEVEAPVPVSWDPRLF